MRVIPVPCLYDNYAYLIEGGEAGTAVVVDPSEAAPVEAALGSAGLRLAGVLATHHHGDHIGGIMELARGRPGLAVVAFAGDVARIEGVTRPVVDGERFSIIGLDFEVRYIPGHTLGAVGFVLFEGGAPWAVFTGDTLFVAGCGRLFEGTPADMHRSLGQVLGSLPDGVRVYCGHEYTESNLRFAAHVEPNNAAVREKAARSAALRSKGQPTVPSTMGEERATNPFLRSDSLEVRKFVGLGSHATGTEVLALVRKAKDEF